MHWRMLTLVSLLLAHITNAEDYTTIKGQIVWPEKKPVPKRVAIKADKDQPVCAQDKDFFSEDWIVDAKSLGIKNVVIWLAPEPAAGVLANLKSGKVREYPSFKPGDIHKDLLKPAQDTVVIEQRCCRFIEHVTLARAGQNLLIKNTAPIPHNPKFVSRLNGAIQPNIPAGGELVLKNLVAERFPIEVSCSIHSWMKCWVRVFDHPYYALTDKEGKFEIKNAPVMGGKLRLFIWQESGGYMGGAQRRLGASMAVKAGTVDLGKIEYEGSKDD